MERRILHGRVAVCLTAVQTVADLSGALLPMAIPGGGWVQRQIGRGFDVNQCVLAEPSLFEQFHNRLPQIAREGWIHKHHIERLCHWLRQKLLRVHLKDRGVVRLQLLGIGAQLSRRLGIELHQTAMRRPARQRFESEDTGASEQIEAAAARQNGRQPVEECLADAVTGWTQAVNGGKAERATAPAPADNAQFVMAGGQWLFRRGRQGVLLFPGDKC